MFMAFLCIPEISALVLYVFVHCRPSYVSDALVDVSYHFLTSLIHVVRLPLNKTLYVEWLEDDIGNVLARMLMTCY